MGNKRLKLKKDQKRILKLLYKKGLLENFIFLNDLCWARTEIGMEIYMHTFGGGVSDLMPLIPDMMGYLVYENVHESVIEDDVLYTLEEYAEYSTFKCKGYRSFIKWLSKLPNINNKSLINKYLYVHEII